MLLTQLEITDFLSINGTLPIDLDKKETILLGSNDHGKSNILRAIEHLNDDVLITEDEVNWDATGVPAIAFVFSLTPTERAEWKSIVEGHLKQMADEVAERDKAESASNPQEQEESQPAEESPSAQAPPAPKQTLTTVIKSPPRPEFPASALNPDATKLTLTRKGVGTSLQFEGMDIDEFFDSMASFFNDKKPRVELFKALSGNLQDSATASTIITDEYEFLQGVFFCAGIDPRQNSQVFTQDDKTIRVLDTASKELDSNLRRLWGQGTELHFELRHKGPEILFLADDPAIKSRKARMSKRSAGVTQFFRVSMVLHARRKKNPANSYIYLFDEPGVLLHPQGQRDLLQVFEQLAEESQIVYATHSLFLLNQNFPERHRLIYKDQNGTKVDQKPYRQNWKLATDALGVYLSSNILFSNKVLLVEGDSDPICSAPL